MARKRDRIFALTIAILFFAVSFGTSFVVLWQMFKDNKEAKNVNQTTETNSTGGQKLQGTNLQGFVTVAQVDKLQTEDLKVGTGTEAKAGDTVVVDYTGAISASGIIFQSSLDSGQPAALSLNNVIKGWQDGIPGMKVGGTRRLLIPADMAYGANPPQGSGIPANAPLVFDVTLHSVGGNE